MYCNTLEALMVPLSLHLYQGQNIQIASEDGDYSHFQDSEAQRAKGLFSAAARDHGKQNLKNHAEKEPEACRKSTIKASFC